LCARCSVLLVSDLNSGLSLVETNGQQWHQTSWEFDCEKEGNKKNEQNG